MCVFYVREDIIPMYTLLLHGIYALNGASFKITSWTSSQDWVSTFIVAVKFYSHLTNSAVGMLEKLNKQRYYDHDTQSGACTLQEIWW